MSYDKTLRMLLTAFLLLGATRTFAQDGTERSAILAEAQLVKRTRAALIMQRVAWVDELRAASDEKIAAFFERRDVAFQGYLEQCRTPELRANLKQAHDRDAIFRTREQLIAAQLSPLVGILRPDEVARWAVAFALEGPLVLPASTPGGIRDDLTEQLVVRIGRRASIELVSILRSQPLLPASKRARLDELVIAIEGPAAAAFLAEPTTLPVPPIWERQPAGPPLKYMLVPEMPSEQYQGHDERFVVQLAARSRVGEPGISPAIFNSGPQAVNVALDRLASLGDLAVAKGGVILPRRSYRNLGNFAFTRPLTNLDQESLKSNLSPFVPIGTGAAFLLRTTDNQLAVVHFLGQPFNNERPICYLLATPETRELPVSSVPSTIEFALTAKTPEFGELVAHERLVGAQLATFRDQYIASTTALARITEPSSGASVEERLAAIVLLGELRADDLAPALVNLLGSGEEATVEATVLKALRRMVFYQRDAFFSQLKTAADPRRHQLASAFEKVEGPAAAKALLAAWKKAGN